MSYSENKHSTANTIEEARDKRSKLAMSFFSRAIVIVDENGNEVE